VSLSVDGTTLSCKGAIAQLTLAFRGLPPGSLARVRVADIPSRIDIRAWADRHGHRCVEEVRHGTAFELVISKGGDGSADASRAPTDGPARS